ncbi:aspartate--tRNA(Asn) ligase [Candidatus Pacearchaeota archaeon CG10_big_fil_rev_8_21_14_0_10_31_9]|nr:MAG: aspartate--tRNA(Asn) ligase [Candidatus Pacearchaeota archaeon CG1_02_32_21]PIN96167.1 MAG: aspartate--tRNA(Asn) ligase [Candidatus Pacearchaeota archaeon CG10_big_fil_rev_8_21_14_0_10_31_9]PIZ83048.1 MAG: aspartate--tRNA(Asn) ligase [Candidatus Pacearchaeota archaeon CG_4_10_14_0_2_um_filter_05_32_18]
MLKEKKNELERTYIKDAFSKNGKVFLKGWVYEVRDLSKIRFVILRDVSGQIQTIGLDSKTDKESFELMKSLNRESVISVIGDVKESKQAPGGKEVLVEKIEVIAKAENPLPIDVSDFSKTELPKRLDYRFLDLHRKETQAIFKIQSTIQQAYMEFMIKEGAVMAQFPSIIGSSSEGGTDLFNVQYFEKKACLSQSCQLYKQMLACSMEKVFAIFTVWRAEKHNTVRHLNESRQFDYEQAFADDKIVMEVLGRCVQYIVKRVMELNKEELEVLNVKLKVPGVNYLTFGEVSEMMKKYKIHVGKDDLSGDAEKKLGELYPDTVVFVHDWPLSGKPFYIMPKGKDLSYGFDAIYQGMEISSGGQRVHLPELLIERLKAKGLNPKDFKAYVDSFRFGAPPHAGWGVGLERITMLILGLPNIREAVLFPRDRDRLTP